MKVKIDTKTCVGRNFSKSFEEKIKQGDIELTFLTNNFKRTDIFLTKKKLLNREYINIAAKSLFCNLQVGVYFICNGKIAIFKRSKYDKDQRENLTSEFTILKAWSPKSLADDDKLESLSRKAQILTHSNLIFEDKGIAYTNVEDVTKTVAPYYIFIIYKIEIDDEKKLTTQKVEDHKVDQFVDWLEPNDYNYLEHSFDYEYFDHQTEANNTVHFDGAIDRCVLFAIKDNYKNEKYSDLSRGNTIYFPRKRIIETTTNQCFEKSEIILDNDKIKYKLLDLFTKKNKRNRSKPKLNDILIFEPNWFGFGFRFNELIKYVKETFDVKKEKS